jgi:hypothetical protein
VKIGREDGVRLKKKKKKKRGKVMHGEMGAFGNKHLLEMERVVVRRPYFENVWAMSHTEVLLDAKHQHNFFSHTCFATKYLNGKFLRRFKNARVFEYYVFRNSH